MESGHPLYSWLAVDGLNGTDPFYYECSHTTNTPNLTSWFMVELKVMSKVVKVEVLARYFGSGFYITGLFESNTFN